MHLVLSDDPIFGEQVGNRVFKLFKNSGSREFNYKLEFVQKTELEQF